MSTPRRSLFSQPSAEPVLSAPDFENFSVVTPLPADSLLPWAPLSAAYKFTSLVAFRPLPPGLYDLVAYKPTAVLNTYLTLHAIYPQGVRPTSTKSKAELELQQALILGFTVSSKTNPLSQSAAHVLAGVPSRISSLSLTNVQPDTLSKNGIETQLVFKSPQFVMQHARNTFTLLTLTSLPERLTDVLTSV